MTQYIALTSSGLENLLLDELTALGAIEVKQSVNSVSFEADLTTAYHICLWSRFSSRVLQLLSRHEVASADDLYQAAQSLTWSSYLHLDQTFAIDFVGTNEFINNTQFGALKVKDAIADQFVQQQGSRPNVDKYRPDINIQVRLRKQSAAFYLDFSGPSLHQRGYRQSQGGAPLKENLAAAIITRSGWLDHQDTPLLDPFCGSGTLLIEAVMMAAKMAPGLTRPKFAFEAHHDFDPGLFDKLKQQAIDCQVAVDHLDVKGSDIEQRMVNIARENADAAGLGRCIQFSKVDASKLRKSQKLPGYIVCNPPYGERMGETTQVAYLYADFSNALKKEFVGWQLAFFTQDSGPIRQLRLSKSKMYKMRNGPLDCLLYLYDLTELQVQMDESVPRSLLYHSNESESFANRLKKNDKKYRQLAKKANVNCYRIYDADIPEYNVAVDRYAEKLVIYEYAAPKTVDPKVAQLRLNDAILACTLVLGVPSTDIAIKVREKQKGTQQYQTLNTSQQTFVVQEFGVNLAVNIHDYLDTGLFLDHRLTRQLIGRLSQDKSVLNLFAYTGSASVHAALGGAKAVTTMDMSKTYLDWAKQNFALNDLTGRQYRFLQGDCLQWIENDHQNEMFDLIFIDPPTFSNSKRMNQTFDVLRDHVQLLTGLKQRLNAGGVIIFSNNHRRFKMDETALNTAGLQVENITQQTIPFDFDRNSKIHNCWKLTVA